MNIKELMSIKLSGVALECKDVKALSKFYLDMLGWEIAFEDDGFMSIRSPLSNVNISFQRNIDYIPPVWPEQENEQQMMLHLDFKADSEEQMQIMVQHAISCGAKKAETQYSDKWTVMTDPAGHPFCIDTL